MYKIILILLIFTGLELSGQLEVKGRIEPKPTIELLINDVISNNITICSADGHFSLYVPSFQDSIDLLIIEDGVVISRFSKKLKGIKNIVISLNDSRLKFDEVIVFGNRSSKANIAAELDISLLQKRPGLLGETDILKGIQRLRGVKFNLEGSSDFVVRGGNVGENQILLDGMPTYVNGHVFGMLSHIQSDPIKKVQFYNSAFPASYSGKLSSIVDMKTKDLEEMKDTFKINIGLTTSSIYVEKKASKKIGVLVGARTSPLPLYHQLIKLTNNPPPYAAFYDVLGKASFYLNPKSSIHFSGIYGTDWLEDPFSFNKDVSFTNSITSAPFTSASYKYRSGKFEIESSFSMALYNNKFRNYHSANEFEYDYRYNHRLQQNFGKSTFKYFFTNDINIAGGLSYDKEQFTYSLYPNYFQTNNTSNDSFSLGNKIVRSHFSLEYYRPNFLLNIGAVYIKNLAGENDFIEPRIKASYISEYFDIYTSFSNVNQFNTLISNRSLGNYIKIWVPANAETPLQSNDLSLGIKNSNHPKFSFGFEIYKKWRTNLAHLSEGSRIHITSKEVAQIKYQGNGNSFGLETWFNAKFKGFKINSNLTLSRSFLQFNEINEGHSFPDYNDRLVTANIDMDFEITKRWELLIAFTFYSGNPYTYSSGSFPSTDGVETGTTRLVGSIGGNGRYFPVGLNFAIDELNNRRLPAHHRLDFNLQRKGMFLKKFSSNLSLGVYNAYFRNNPLYVKFDPVFEIVDTRAVFKGIKYTYVSYFIFIPSISYSIHF
ncbi:MAG: TonB-dependent receptor plug domain-containing protein [Saprospiraceae bacterium]|nr:TonB-dependent receptor plug domain-containing protein [Saprospiraceae bacterium]